MQADYTKVDDNIELHGKYVFYCSFAGIVKRDD